MKRGRVHISHLGDMAQLEPRLLPVGYTDPLGEIILQLA